MRQRGNGRGGPARALSGPEPPQSHVERRSPTGIARERETRTDDAAPRQSHGGTPVSDRHRAGARNLPNNAGPANLTARSAGLRPASRGSAKPAPTTPRPANLTAERRSPTGIARQRETRPNNAAPRQSHGGTPVSDRHRAGARNPHRRRRAPPISRLRTHASPTAQNHGDMERWPVLPVGASDRHRAGARNPHRQRRAPPISRLRTHASPTAKNRGDMERWPVLPVGASDRHRAGARNLHRRRWPRLRPVLPVGAGIAARSAANGTNVKHRDGRYCGAYLNKRGGAGRGDPVTQLYAVRPPPAGGADRRSAFPCLRAIPPSGVRAEKGVIPTVGAGAAAALRAAVPAPTGRTGQRSAFPCLAALLLDHRYAVRPPAAGDAGLHEERRSLATA